MNEPAATRFEFRAFGQCFEVQDRRLRAMAPCERITESREIYLLGHRGIGEHNIKVRKGNLESKRLIERRQGMERWKPSGLWKFPIAIDELNALLRPLVETELPSGLPAQVSLDDLLCYVARAGVALYRINLFKRRFIFTIGASKAEVDQLLVNAAAIASVAVESEDLAATVELRTALQLDAHENVSYPLALSRIIGIKSWPGEADLG